MSADTKIHPKSGGGGRKPRLIPAILTLILIACSTIMGCNEHNNPMDAGDSSEIGRFGQGFITPSAWGTAYSTDCATSFWALSVPSQDISTGDIVYQDTGVGTNEFLATRAYVKDNNNQVQSEISLRLYQYFSANYFYDDDFNGGGDASNHLCQHPTVEVTYSREVEAEEGVLRVHVVWSEWNTSYETDNYDLYYRYLEFAVNDDGIGDDPTCDETEWLDFSDSTRDDILPDICVVPSVNDVCVVYQVGTDIKYSYHDYDDMDSPDEWETPTTISSGSNPKWAPRCDGGRFSYDGGTYTPLGGVFAVWSEMVDDEDYENWQVYANECYNRDWAWLGAYRVSFSGMGDDEINYLPQVDILPQSSDIGEAVIVWDNAQWEPHGEVFTNYRVKITATPYHTSCQEYLDYANDCRGADVSCYQRWEYDDMEEDYEWFAVSFQGFVPLSNYWQVRATSYSFYDNGSDYTFNKEQEAYILYSEGQWSFDYPGTAPSIALFWPYNMTTTNKSFILSYIDTDGGSDFDAYRTSGDIN